LAFSTATLVGLSTFLGVDNQQASAFPINIFPKQERHQYNERNRGGRYNQNPYNNQPNYEDREYIKLKINLELDRINTEVIALENYKKLLEERLSRGNLSNQEREETLKELERTQDSLNIVVSRGIELQKIFEKINLGLPINY
jgi:hypothetical protein